MVLSTTKRTASIKSITNANQGGGEKKAGIPPSVGKNSWMNILYTSRGNGLLSLRTMRDTNATKINGYNLPVGLDKRIPMR